MAATVTLQYASLEALVVTMEPMADWHSQSFLPRRVSLRYVLHPLSGWRLDELVVLGPGVSQPANAAGHAAYFGQSHREISSAPQWLQDFLLTLSTQLFAVPTS
jgi:hypothetical protein